jgi:hypothetical protein
MQGELGADDHAYADAGHCIPTSFLINRTGRIDPCDPWARGPRLPGLWQDGWAGYNPALIKRALKTSS